MVDAEELADMGPPDSLGPRPYMPDPSKGILESLDFTDIVEEIKYRIRRWEIDDTKGADGSRRRVWKAPEPVQTLYMDVDGQVKSKLVEIKPLLNRLGEHDILSLLTAIMTRNTTLSFIAADNKGVDIAGVVTKRCFDIGDTLIDLLMFNYKRYNIHNSKHMGLVYEIVMNNIERAFSQALGNKGRQWVSDSMTESKTVLEKLRGPEEL